MSFLSRLFTPPGSSERGKQVARQADVANQAMEGVSALMPSMIGAAGDLSESYKMLREREPLRQANITSAQNTQRAALTSDNTDTIARRAGRTAKNAYMDTANQAPNVTSEWGKAVISAAANASAKASNDIFLQENDLANLLQKKGSLTENILTLEQSRANSPADAELAQMAQLYSLFTGAVYGQPEVQVGKGIGDILGQVAGLGLNSLFGPKGGGGTSPNTMGGGGVPMSMPMNFMMPTGGMNLNAMSRSTAPSFMDLMRAAPVNQFDATRNLFGSQQFGGTLGSAPPTLRYWN